MAQDLTVNIKTTSDVPQAMDKAKTATTGFAKQVEDIGKKFGTSFKDIFLSFLGPMALLTGAIAIIGKIIADNQRKQQEATQAAIDGTNALMSAEDRYYANKLDKEKKLKESQEEAKTAREVITKEFLLNDPRGKALVEKESDPGNNQPGFLKFLGRLLGEQKSAADKLSRSERVQGLVQGMIAEDAAKSGVSDSGLKAGSFKGPEGFGTVVGVGANPVMEKMTRQNEILEEIKIILQEQSLINKGGMVPSPFTEAVPVTLQKIGAV
jgi:hypothetical protein